MINKKELIVSIIVLLSLFIGLNFIFAVTTIENPASGANISGIISFNCTTTVNTSTWNYNVTIYYNASGGDANKTAVHLTNITNSSDIQGSFNTTINISSLSDGRNYNFSCWADNGTTQQIASARTIKIDKTPPNVSAFNSLGPVGSFNATNNQNYSSSVLLFINVSVDDSVMGVESIYFNVTYPNGTMTPYYNFSKASRVGITYNYTINSTNFTQGHYNITVFANDSVIGNINNTKFIYVAFDSTPPAVSIATEGGVNLSGTKTLNASVSDAVIGIEGVYFNITNSSGVQLNFTRASNSGGTNYNISLPTTTFLDGKYNVTIFANDSEVNNLNNSQRIQITIDNTNPSSITYSCTPSSVSVGAVITCTCAGEDALSGINLTSYTVNPLTVNTGTFTETCTVQDRTGHSLSGQFTYTVESGGSGSSGGGGSGTISFYTKTIPKTSQDFSITKTINQELAAKEQIKIKINNEEHFVGVRQITSNSATVEISSNPVQITLEVGKDTKVDVNNDGYYDIYVKLNNIVNNKADLTVNYLHEGISQIKEENKGETKEPETIITTEELKEEKNLTWLWVLIGIIIVLALAGAGYWIKKKE